MCKIYIHLPRTNQPAEILLFPAGPRTALSSLLGVYDIVETLGPWSYRLFDGRIADIVFNYVTTEGDMNVAENYNE